MVLPFHATKALKSMVLLLHPSRLPRPKHRHGRAIVFSFASILSCYILIRFSPETLKGLLDASFEISLENGKLHSDDWADAAREAVRVLDDRKRVYDAEGRPSHWKLRGTGYLYHRQNLLLAATLPGPRIALSGDGGAIPVAVRIDNVLPFLAREDDESDGPRDVDAGRRRRVPHRSPANYCEKLTIWVRVNGPEILAGNAIPVVDDNDDGGGSSSCHWEFPANLTKAGTYFVDTKVIVWNGRAPLNVIDLPDQTDNLKMRCRHREGDADYFRQIQNASDLLKQEDAGRLTSGGFIGFKFYRPARSCCEICTRTPGCLYWVTPPKDLDDVERARNGCELFFRDDKNEINENHNSNVTAAAGYVPAEQASGILYPRPQPRLTTRHRRKLKLRREIVQLQNRSSTKLRQRQVDGAAAATARPLKRKEKKHAVAIPPMHGARGENLSPDDVPYYVGCGWSFWHTLDFPCASADLDDRVVHRQNRTSFEVVVLPASASDRQSTVQKAEVPALSQSQRLPRRLCTASDEIASKINPTGRGPGGGRWVRQPWPEEECGTEHLFEKGQHATFDITKFDDPSPNKPHCWHRDNLEQIGKLCIEMNCKLIRPSSIWYSSVHQEQQFYGTWQKDDCDYLEYTTEELQECITERKISEVKVFGASIAKYFKNYIEQRTKDIVFFDENSPEALQVHINTLMQTHLSINNKDNLDKAFRSADESPGRENYYFRTMYLSSERDMLLFADYQWTVSNWAESILLGKNWTILDTFGPSVAFTFDTATQNDGMHIIGPPMKTAATKLFHHMCHTNNPHTDNNYNDINNQHHRGTVVGLQRQPASAATAAASP